jgi:hypothetical protein
VNNSGCDTPDLSSQEEEDCKLMPTLVRHRLKISDFGWAEPKDIKKATIFRVLAIVKVETQGPPATMKMNNGPKCGMSAWGD